MTTTSVFNKTSKRWSSSCLKQEGTVLFNDALNTFYLRLYGVRHIVKNHSDREKGKLLPPHKLLFQLVARVLLYASSHRQDNTYHGLCYTCHGALAGMRNSPMGPPWRIDPTTIAPWANTITTELHLAPVWNRFSRCIIKEWERKPDSTTTWATLSDKSFICMITQTDKSVPWPLLLQLWSIGWNKK